MTLVAVNYGKNTFHALSDSRVSTQTDEKYKRVTDRFTKLYAIPYRFTVGNDLENLKGDYLGEVGFAFAGSTLLATALHAMCSNLLRNMHDSLGKADAPSFDAIGRIVLSCAELLHEETVFGGPMPYEAMIFGFCPREKIPRLQLLTLTQQSGKFEYTMIDRPLTEGMTYSIGSGAQYFRTLIRTLPSENLEAVFLRSVNENPDEGTGGPVQILRVTAQGAEFLGIIQATADQESANIVISGVTADEIGKVEDYELGRILMGVGVAEANNRGALRRLGFDPDSQSITREIKNMAAFSSMLVHLNANKEKGVISDDASFEPLSPENGKHYFSVSCSKCWRMTPILHDDSEGHNPQPFEGFGKLKSNCIHCSAPVEIAAQLARSTRWK